MLAIAERHHPLVLESEPTHQARRAALRDGHIWHLRDARIGGIEKLANATHLTGVPFVDGFQHVVGIVAIGAFEQLARIDEHHLMTGAVGDEHTLETDVVVPRMFRQRNDPDGFRHGGFESRRG